MVEKGSTGDVRQALDYGADVNGKTNDGRTALNVATRNGQLETMELLIARGARVNLHDEEVRRGGLACFDTVAACYMAGFSSGGKTPLHMVAKYAQTLEPSRTPKIKQMVDLLFANGADVNASAKAGDTPLHEAAWRLQRDLAELLIAHGANVNAKDKKGATPLTYAVTSPLKRFSREGAYVSVVELIQDHGGE